MVLCLVSFLSVSFFLLQIDHTHGNKQKLRNVGMMKANRYLAMIARFYALVQTTADALIYFFLMNAKNLISLFNISDNKTLLPSTTNPLEPQKNP